MDKRIEYWTTAPAGYRAFMGVKNAVLESGIEHRLIHLVWLRVSQINGCAYCVDLHWRDALAAGVEARVLNAVAAWDEMPCFDARERAAFAWAEALTLVAATRAPEPAYRAAEAEFGAAGMCALSYAIAYMNAMNRLGVGFRMQPNFATGGGHGAR